MTAANFPIIVCRLYRSTTQHSLDSFFCECVSTSVSARKCVKQNAHRKKPPLFCSKTRNCKIFCFCVCLQILGSLQSTIASSHLRALTFVLTRSKKVSRLWWVVLWYNRQTIIGKFAAVIRSFLKIEHNTAF